MIAMARPRSIHAAAALGCSGVGVTVGGEAGISDGRPPGPPAHPAKTITAAASNAAAPALRILMPPC
ncbi:hypothetical protein GCM10025768_25930 [Microbacterium pseudoresistens]